MKNIIIKAIEASNNSYSPYSKFKVGAAVLLNNGDIITGTNIENVSYGLTMCAERSALFTVYSLGFKKDDIKEIAVYSNTIDFISPCGACRQVMNELMNNKTTITLVNGKNNFTNTTIEKLLPYSFKELK